MIPWWTLLIAACVVIFAIYELFRVAGERNMAMRALQIVEMEYRLMSQNSEMFRRIEETHEEMKSKFEEAINEVMEAK